MRFYRVFPYDATAPDNAPGGALFVPPGGMNRIDNPSLYRVFYAAEEPEAAVGESFGRLPIWRTETFIHASGNPYAIATYEIDDLVLFDLDDVSMLQSIGIVHPTDVVTRDRARTQAWAKDIFLRGGFGGARWWSFYHPSWYVVGIWQHNRLRLIGRPQVITSVSAEVTDAVAGITRQIIP